MTLIDPVCCPDPDVSTFAPEEWALTHTPVVGDQATVTRPLVVGQKHIATSISFGISTEGVAPGAASTVTINLRDGATAAGPVLMSWRIRVPAVTQTNIQRVVYAGFNVAGTVGAAMTLEFENGIGATLQDVTLTGYTV